MNVILAAPCKQSSKKKKMKIASKWVKPTHNCELEMKKKHILSFWYQLNDWVDNEMFESRWPFFKLYVKPSVSVLGADPKHIPELA